jgi:hypothetical protein
MRKAGPSAAAGRRDGSRGGNRKSKSPPCVCKERRHKDGAPSELKRGKGWASPQPQALTDEALHKGTFEGAPLVPRFLQVLFRYRTVRHIDLPFPTD